MDAVKQRAAQAFQFLGGGDIGQHHEFLDQLVRSKRSRKFTDFTCPSGTARSCARAGPVPAAGGGAAVSAGRRRPKAGTDDIVQQGRGLVVGLPSAAACACS